jgi:hypothetical protein
VSRGHLDEAPSVREPLGPVVDDGAGAIDNGRLATGGGRP